MKDGFEYLGRARFQGLALLLLVFLVGVLVGVAGERLAGRRSAPVAAPPPREDDGRPRLPKVLEDMDLAPAQRAAIDSILASGRPRNEAILNTVLPQLRAVGDSLHAGIRSVLTPAQAAEFDAYLRSHPPRTPSPPTDDRGEVRDAGGHARREPPARASDRRRPGEERPAGERDGRRPPPPEGGPPPRGGAPPPQPDGRG